LVLSERAYVGGASPPATFEDESRFGNDGTHTNITWKQLPSGLWGRTFNGSSSVVTIAHASSLNVSSLSFMCWVNFSSLSTNPTIINKKETTYDQADGWHLFWTTAKNKWGFRIGIQNPESDAVTVTTGTWYFVAVVKTGANIHFYQNAVAIGTTGGMLAFVDNTDEIRLGELSDDYPNWLPADMGLPKLLNYGISTEQIAAIFQAERHWFGV